nr:DUF2244 domain-containing protein [uncultured Celeribacter sp.]
MPYRWSPDPTTTPNDIARTAPEDAPLWTLDLWPHRSLKGKGFSATIWIMFIGGLIPIVPFIGTIAFWVLLIFMMCALAALWTAIRSSDRDKLREELRIWPDRVTLTHWSAKGERLTWESNPYWLKLTLHPKSGRIEHYLTLKGAGPDVGSNGGREVELGAFLTPKERQRLYGELQQVLAPLKA